VERSPDPEQQEWASVSLKFADQALAPLLVAFSPGLIAAISAPPPAAQTEPPEAPQRVEPGTPDPPPLRSRTMDLLLDVDLPVSISFGKAQLLMKDVLKLTTGSIVELNRGVSEQVEVLVNQCLIARGEVVVIDGNYGVRIQEIASRQDRLRTLR
jgi:flagellar motor switch protein FliN/FliY